MPIDWNAVETEIGHATERAAAKTDERLASRISSITRLTDAEVQSLFPTPADVKKLTELMKIVKSAQARNDKVNQIVANVESLAGTVITLLERFA